MHGKIVASACISALLLAGAANAEPLKIRMSWVAPVTNWASIWLEKKDLARHFGQTYVVEPTQFQGTPPMITALANNQLELSNLAYSTLGIAIENAGLNDLRMRALTRRFLRRSTARRSSSRAGPAAARRSRRRPRPMRRRTATR